MCMGIILLFFIYILFEFWTFVPYIQNLAHKPTKDDTTFYPFGLFACYSVIFNTQDTRNKLPLILKLLFIIRVIFSLSTVIELLAPKLVQAGLYRPENIWGWRW